MDPTIKWLSAVGLLIVLVIPSWLFALKYLKKLANDHNVKYQNTVLLLLFVALCLSAAWLVGLFVL